MRWISSILVAALLIQIGYVPCAAEEPVTPKRDEIERSKLKVGMYVEVTYYSEKGEKKTTTAYIMAIEYDSVTIGRGMLWKERIAYRDIIDLTTQEQKAKNQKQKTLRSKVVPGARIRIIAAGRPTLTGIFISADAGTLVMKSESGRQLSIPFTSSIKKCEVHVSGSNWGKGMLYGSLAGGALAAVLAAVSSGDMSDDDWLASDRDIAIGLSPFLVVGGAVLGLFFGATAKYEYWQEISLDQLRIGLSPQRQGGIMLSTSFTF